MSERGTMTDSHLELWQETQRARKGVKIITHTHTQELESGLKKTRSGITQNQEGKMRVKAKCGKRLLISF